MTNLSISKFAENGIAIVPNFYDVGSILEIQNGIREVIQFVSNNANVRVPCATPIEAMTAGYTQLIKHDRRLGGVVYDAVKQIPAFMRLVTERKNEELFLQLRPSAAPGIAAGGYGMRIDNPGEDRFRAFWHQEFPSQLRSLDGLVFWSPLLPVTADMGPVEVAIGSHRDGLLPVTVDDGGAGKTGMMVALERPGRTRSAWQMRRRLYRVTPKRRL
jgi:hypothetical protein